MKQKTKIKLPPINILKETPEERKQRVQQSGSSMITKVVPNKKKKTSKQQRQMNSKEIKHYDESF